MKQIKMLLLTSMVIFFTACGGGGGSSITTAPPVNAETPQAIAIDKIMTYANDNTQSAPTVQDYADASVVGVTLENIDDVNHIVANLTPSDVDTTEEIQKIVDDLGINILPVANAGANLSSQINQTITITGKGIDSDGTIVSYEWKKGETVLADTASFDYTPTEVGTDTLTFTVTDDDGATASDSMNVTVAAAPPVDTEAIAIDTIGAYADDNTLPAPTVEVYTDAGVTGVTADNIDSINTVVGSLSEEDVSTQEEVESLVDEILRIDSPTPSKPSITLNGPSPMNISVGESFVDPGATLKEGDDSKKIFASESSIANLDTSAEGSYTLSYTATDSAGKLFTALRKVNVLPADEIDKETIVYENGEDGLSDGWYIYDYTPAGATVTNVDDPDKAAYDAAKGVDKGSRVIKFDGSAIDNGYTFGGTWNQTEVKVTEWSMKFSEYFNITLGTTTTKGHRSFVYTPVNGSVGLDKEIYIRIGLGADADDGTWKTFPRNLQEDLDAYDPGNELLSVDYISIRGSGMVDDIKFIIPE